GRRGGASWGGGAWCGAWGKARGRRGGGYRRAALAATGAASVAVARIRRFWLHARSARPGPARPGPGHLFSVRRKALMTSSPLVQLTRVMRQNGLIRFIEHFAELFPTSHLKDLTGEEIGPGRRMVVGGRAVMNFGSDSFLGLDQDPRVQEAVRRGLAKWGTHN